MRRYPEPGQQGTPEATASATAAQHPGMLRSW